MLRYALYLENHDDGIVRTNCTGIAIRADVTNVLSEKKEKRLKAENRGNIPPKPEPAIIPKLNSQSTFVAKITDGISLNRRGSKVIVVFATEILHKSATQQLLDYFFANKRTFHFYDPLYPKGSSSDPGSYFSYSPVGAKSGTFFMTYGNHGWSGGIYEIDFKVVSAQLRNLFNEGLIAELQIDDAGFFSHYKMKTRAENEKINIEIMARHTSK